MKNLLTLLMLCSMSIPPLFAQQFFTGTSSSEAQEFYDQAISSMEQSAWGLAQESLVFALEQDSNFIDAHIAHGVVSRKLYQQGAALKSFNKAISLYPRSLLAHEQLALLYQEMEYFKDAVKVYRQLLNHYPGYAAGYAGLAKAYYSIGEKNGNSDTGETVQSFANCVKSADMAMRLYLRTENNRNAADVRLLAGRAYMELGDYSAALKYIKACKRQLEDKPYFYYYLGLCYFRKGDKEKAQSNLEIARVMGYQVPKYLENQLKNWH